MRKALIPMLASLALCGAGTAALIATNGRALANSRKPVMVALLGDMMTAQNLPDTPPASNASTSPDFAPDPRQFCDDRYAGEVGRMAYLETRLHLTDAEQPLFAHWRDVHLDIAKRRAADCSARIGKFAQDIADPVEQMRTEEKVLRQRVADIDVERPVFSTLYATLAPDQRRTLTPPRPMLGHDHGAMPPLPHEMDDLPPPPMP